MTLTHMDHLRIPLLLGAIEMYWHEHPDETLMDLLHGIADIETSDEMLYHMLCEMEEGQ